MPGSPWFRLFGSSPGVFPKLGSSQGHYAREIRSGPPIPGAPWFSPLLIQNAPGVLPPQVSQATKPNNLFLVAQVTGLADRRLGRFTQQIATLVNSLIEAGYIRFTGSNPPSFTILGGALTGAGPPTAATDFTLGAVVGSVYLDTTAKKVYFCTSNTTGLATWNGPY